VEGRVLLVGGVPRRRVDHHLALLADGGRVVLQRLHLAPLDVGALGVEALRGRGERRRLLAGRDGRNGHDHGGEGSEVFHGTALHALTYPDSGYGQSIRTGSGPASRGLAAVTSTRARARTRGRGCAGLVQNATSTRLPPYRTRFRALSGNTSTSNVRGAWAWTVRASGSRTSTPLRSSHVIRVQTPCPL